MKRIIAIICISSLICLAGSRECDRCGRTTDGYMYNVGLFTKVCSSCHSKIRREKSQEDGIGFGTIIIIGGIIGGIIVACVAAGKKTPTEEK